ncbi:MAG TPA: citrate/2-methylcitrate synthase [Candidatus Binataceae bacterium]|nr:citrate/2-methylcitrate synthase [Candidatus Binataceae bacterium]
MLTASEAAAQLGVKLGTLYAYVSRGWLKSYRRKVGRQALYRRSDIEALRGVIAPERGVRARSLPDASSWVTVAQPPTDGSPTGVIVAESAISSIIDGQLAYRGYPIEELVEHASFEEVCLVLWGGERPRPEEVEHLRAAIATARIPAPVAAALAAVGADAPPLLRLAVMMPSLAAAEHRLPARSRIDQARMIITVLPLGLAARAVVRDAGDATTGGVPGIAAQLCARLAVGAGDAADREALERVLVACAEHELNASTFAARVVASTGADLYASVLAALCSLSGPIHGGACDRIESMFADLDAARSIDQALDVFSAKHRLPPGFGHTIYPDGDPRAALLKRVAKGTAKRKGPKLFETALKVEEAVWRREQLRPNLDFYLTVCVRLLGFGRGTPAAIFAIGRAAGWIAHSLEQSADNRLIRPRMRYHGSALRHWDH